MEAPDINLSSSRLRLINDMNPDIYSVPYNELIVDSFDSLHRWIPWAQRPPPLEETRAALEQLNEYDLRGYSCTFMIYSKEHGKIIGGCRVAKLHSPVCDRVRDQVLTLLQDYKNPGVLGFWLNKRYEGRGYVTEACKLMMEYGIHKLGMDCYLAEVDKENEKSVNVVKRLGFDVLVEDVQIHRRYHRRTDWPDYKLCDVYIKKVP